MQKRFLFLLISLSSLFLFSCHSDDPDPNEPTAAKSVFVFMPHTANNSGGNSLYYNLQANLNDMEAAINDSHGLSGNRLIVFIAQDATTSRLIDFTYKKGHCVRDTLKTYTNIDYTTAEGLTTVIADMKRNAPANEYAMIVGCHGEGWLPKDSETRYFGGARYKIDISDLAKGIMNNGIKMQYILFDDCYMSAIEVAYDLRSATDYLIASTSEMMDYGMPYRRILKYLLATEPDYQAICDNFLAFYKNYSMPYGTIGVTNVNKVDQFANFMTYANTTHTLAASDIDKIQDLDALHFTPTVYFDLGSYVKTLCNGDQQAMTAYAQVINELVPYKAATDYIYSYSGRATVPVREFSGLTISDPSENNIAVDAKKLTGWWKATHSQK